MTRIAYLVSSARQLLLEDGSTRRAGSFCAADILRPYERFTSAGAEVVVITPDGQSPSTDTYGLPWFFDCPDEDSDYLASVVRTFATHAEDIRMTLHQYADLDLTAARRVDALLQGHGRTASQAHQALSAAARSARDEDRTLVQVLADGSLGLTLDQIQDAVEAQRADSQRLAAQRHAELQTIPGFRQPVALSSLTAADIDSFDALFVPGGYGPMTDMSDNPDVRRLLLALHRKGVPLAMTGHGPAALLSAGERQDGLWMFDGYRMTSITDEEEDQTAAGRLGMAWRLDVALKNAGAVYDDGPSAWVSHVVADRTLITGQNPASTAATAGALLRRLGLQDHPTSAPMDPPPRGVASPPMTRSPRDTVERFLDAVAELQVGSAMTLVAPRVAATIHPLKVDGIGADVLRQILSDFLLGFPNLTLSVDSVITTGDVVTCLFRMGGTQSADYAGAISQNKHLDIAHAWRFVVIDGVITEVSAYWCQAQLYRRLAVKRYDELAIA